MAQIFAQTTITKSLPALTKRNVTGHRRLLDDAKMC